LALKIIETRFITLMGATFPFNCVRPPPPGPAAPRAHPPWCGSGLSGWPTQPTR
jgi:hypothetical protein